MGGTKEITLAVATEVFAGFKTEITAGILFEKNSAVKKGDNEVEVAEAAAEKKKLDARLETIEADLKKPKATIVNIGAVYVFK